MENEIHATGWPRSGNNWVSELLSDLLDSPVDRGAGPTWYGPGQGGPFVLRFHHSRVQELGPVDGFVVLVYRDPRDVAVSKMYYNHGNVVFGCMKAIASPRALDYKTFITDWLDNPNPRVTHLQYEGLHHAPHVELRRVLDLVGEQRSDEQIHAVVERHTFKTSCEQKRVTLNLPPGEKLWSMRRGAVGEWRTHFDRRTGEFAEEHLGELMRRQGYTTSPDWWRELPEEQPAIPFCTCPIHRGKQQ